MSVDLLATPLSSHIDDEVDLDGLSNMEGGGNHVALEEQDLDGMVFNDHDSVVKDGDDPSGQDLDDNQPEEQENDTEKASNEGKLTTEAQDGFDVESIIAVNDHVKSENSVTVNIPAVEIMLDANETTVNENTSSITVASLIAGSNMQQEDAMSEIDYDHNDDDSVDLGTEDQVLAQVAEDENTGEEPGNSDEAEFMPVEDSQNEALQTDPSQRAQQKSSLSGDSQKNGSDDHEYGDSMENTDFTGIGDAEAEETDVHQPQEVDILDDQDNATSEGFAIEPSENDNEYHEDTDYMDVTELDQSPDDFSNPPTVQVHYRGTSYALFQKSYEDEPDSFFFSDVEALEFPLSQFLASLREVVEDVANDDEVLIRIDELGLEFAETTDKKLLDQTTFRSLVDLYDRLVRADDPDSQHHTLQIFLVTRPNCQRRLEALLDGANVGEGLKAYRLVYPQYLTEDFSVKPTGSVVSPSHRDEESDVDLGHYDELEGEELDALDVPHHVEDQGTEDQVVTVEEPYIALHGISDGQVIDENNRSASVTSDQAHSHHSETVDTEGHNVDDDAAELVFGSPERQMGDLGSPDHFDEGEDQEVVEFDEQMAPDASHEVSADHSGDPNALAAEDEDLAEDHITIDMEEHLGPDVTASVRQSPDAADHDAKPPYKGDSEGAVETIEEFIELEGLPEPVEAHVEAHHGETTGADEVGHKEWQDQGNHEDEVVAGMHDASSMPHHESGEPLAEDESEQTSASVTLAGDEVEAIDPVEIAVPAQTDGNVVGGVEQHEADEIDWEDNGDETATGGTHLSTPASNSGKRGRADDGDEVGGQHDVKRHRA